MLCASYFDQSRESSRRNRRLGPMNQPPLAQCCPNHYLAAVAVALQFVPRCHYGVDRHAKATQQVQVDVTAQMEGVDSAPYHQQIKIAVRPIRPRAADPQRMILSGRATSTMRRMTLSEME